jgi:eukaryotic-like serine/threonine-protein kinase
MISQIISHYKILDKLGEGGMGVVYKARDTKLDRTVALKFLPPHLTASEEDKQRFIREAKAAAALNHPHICTINSVDEHDGNQFIVMEYVDGVTLRARFKTGPPYSPPLVRGDVQGGLSLDQAINLSLQIAEALAEAHEQGIVHRDIKPDNIMVTSRDRIKVMDFGLAKLKGSVEVTRAGTTVGTVKYMAPEQMQGDNIDHRSDIWSFGVVLYEIISGRPPFQAEYESALIYQIINDVPPRLQEYRPDVPEKLAHIVHRMIEKSPDDRYDSMKSVINDLRGIIGEKTVVEQSDTATVSTEQTGIPVAVIDFLNITGQDEDAWLSGGIAETVTVDLAKVSSLRVVSRERVLACPRQIR